MFKNYEIKTINNEEVLFLYLDSEVEFAKLKKDSSKTTLASSINNFLSKKNILFNGKKILLIASGILVGACLLTTGSSANINTKNYDYSTKIIAVNTSENIDYNKVIEDLNTKEEPTETKTEEQVKNENHQTNAETPKKPSTSTTTKPTTNATNKKPNNNIFNSNNQSTIPNQSAPITKPTNPSSPSQVTTNKQMITIKRSNGSILKIELEEYLIGVVAAEMPASFSLEALKAQAIAARTYALKAIANGTTLTDTVSTQAYKDNNALKKTWGNSFNTYYNKIKNAVNATSGLVMYYNNELINAFYHSTSNGFTEDSTAVFGAYPYLKSVESPVDKNVSSYLKNITLSYETISNKLGVPITSLSNITIERNKSNRVSKIIIDNNTYDGIKFRNILGLRSTDFDINLNSDNVSITTKGYGHGVGMSQYGAHEYAKLGWNYSKILKHYYTGITIKKH